MASTHEHAKLSPITEKVYNTTSHIITRAVHISLKLNHRCCSINIMLFTNQHTSLHYIDTSAIVHSLICILIQTVVMIVLELFMAQQCAFQCALLAVTIFQLQFPQQLHAITFCIISGIDFVVSMIGMRWPDSSLKPPLATKDGKSLCSG